MRMVQGGTSYSLATVIVGCAAAWALLAQTALAQAPSAESVLDATAKASSAAAQSWDVTCSDYISESLDSLPATPSQRAEFTVRMRGEEFEGFGRTFIPGAGNVLEPHLYSWKYWDGTRSWGLGNRIGSPVRDSVVKETEEAHRRLVFNQDIGSFLEGRFMHNHEGAWYQILEPAAMKIEAGATVDGHDCLLVSADTAHGTYAIWVDPNTGWGIRQAVIELDAGDLAWGEPLGQTELHAPVSPLVSMRMLVSDVEIANIDGRFIATSGTLDIQCSYADGAESRVQKVVRRSNIQWNPDFASVDAFRIPFDEGADVTIWYEGGFRMQATWVNGWLAPRIDNGALRHIDDTVIRLGAAEAPK